jgi:hypothetical protein
MVPTLFVGTYAVVFAARFGYSGRYYPAKTFRARASTIKKERGRYEWGGSTAPRWYSRSAYWISGGEESTLS